MNDEQKRARLARWVKIGLMGVAAVVISPVVFLAIKGTIGAAIAAVLGLAIVNFAPVVAMKFANWKIRAIVHEAQQNPIPTLQNAYMGQEAALQATKARITDFRTEVNNFSSRTESFRLRYPRDAAKFDAQLQQMSELLALRERKYKQASQELEAFELEIQRANAIWEMSQAAQRMNKTAGIENEDVYAKIKAETAIDSVQSSLNRALAELDSALMDESAQAPALAHNPTATIDMGMAVETQKVPR